ncbi:glycerol-3-phosphate dehydrogenase/oxidase [Pseudocnuella soli]|uniref:glycerol-3-phosphate dehydrogenase/oxidase n=1 Tax=Pseudocnuella soli TaxID=2502779 RepID=UPI001045DBD6|nr:glycerol-3-phosphate dehydrogenase/oxidase [Pseudocnuella soli]
MNAATRPTLSFTRAAALQQIENTPLWDVVVIGGGATGLGIAVDAANRGLKILLLERFDFAQGTSSRSTKLVHGGVRYLAQGQLGLVFEALRERGYLLRNATHLVRKQSFIIPCYNRSSLAKYWAGLKLYDWLSVQHSFGASQWLSTAQVAALLPGVQSNHLCGGIQYFDGQFDDARLALNLAQTAAEQGAALINYISVERLLKKGSLVSGVEAKDSETGRIYEIPAKVVINATGVFVDALMQMDAPETKSWVRPSQGIHLVLERSFLPGNAALMIPQTSDGRVLFALPWYNRLLVGTTDTPLHQHSFEPKALDEEIDFVLHNVAQYLTHIPTRKDVQSVFAGLRPLAAPQDGTSKTKEISRSHKLLVAPSGLITITGGKWTTYRKMAEDAVNAAIKVGGFNPVVCTTKNLLIHGCTSAPQTSHWSIYGSDASAIQDLLQQHPEWQQKIAAGHPYTVAEVIWAVRHEMARTVADVLARRLRLLFLDAAAATEAAQLVARIMAIELAQNEAWEKGQIIAFAELARHYLPDAVPVSNAAIMSQEK